MKSFHNDFWRRAFPFLRSLLDLFFTPCCAICGCRLSRSEREICPTCYVQIPLYCCAEAYRMERLEGEAYIADFHSLFVFRHGNYTQRLIHALKYHGRRGVGIELGRIAARRFGWSPETIDLIIPVPISPNRRRQRGYNQAFCIAEGISRQTGIPADDRILYRRSGHVTHTRLSRDKRLSSIADAFVCRCPSELRGKRVLIVDDVLTTGATLTELAAVLVRAGCGHIEAFTLAVSR